MVRPRAANRAVSRRQLLRIGPSPQLVWAVQTGEIPPRELAEAAAAVVAQDPEAVRAARRELRRQAQREAHLGPDVEPEPDQP